MRPSRTPTELSDSVQSQLGMYSLVAGAAGVSLLALVQPTQAEVVYTKTHQSITPNHAIPIDLTNNGATDFVLKDIHYTTTQAGFSHIGSLSVLAAHARNEVEGYDRFRSYASALKAGVSIGPEGPFKAGRRLMARVFSDTGARPELSSCTGPWSKAIDRYLGFKFLINESIHFGWARLNVTCPGSDVVGTLTGYAYETLPDKPIVTGETNGPDVGTVPPVSLGHLAAGAPADATGRTGK